MFVGFNHDHHKEANVSPADVPEVNLSEFATLIGLEQIASGRYSVLLAANLLGGALSGVQNPAKIVHEIELLEKNELGQFKPPIKNRHPPLKGLWHKHYLPDGLASFAKNVEKPLEGKAMKLLIECWDDTVTTFASARYMKRYKLKAIICYTVEDGAQFSHVALSRRFASNHEQVN